MDKKSFLDIIGLKELLDRLKEIFVIKSEIQSKFVLSDEEPSDQQIGDIWEKEFK